jgi:ubiquinone/menaquinone biosynthesis C-methylase UbiE
VRKKEQSRFLAASENSRPTPYSISWRLEKSSFVWDTVSVSVDSELQQRSVASTDPWEVAYLRFESPEEEIRKFIRRLVKLGADQWPRDAEIVELFCGRGNGLHALHQLGFQHLEGLDLSPRLLAQYQGPAICRVGDCRHLPFVDHSKDVLIVQGGLHHLPNLPEELRQTLAEMHRVLRKNGRVMIVEPWSTPFLTLASWLSENRLARRASQKLDAFAVMVHYERSTYEQWLSQPQVITKLAHTYFTPTHESFAWGKWNFVGTPH